MSPGASCEAVFPPFWEKWGKLGICGEIFTLAKKGRAPRRLRKRRRSRVRPAHGLSFLAAFDGGHGALVTPRVMVSESPWWDWVVFDK